jgi:dipeptidyl aminopeptidase/acylaminoacyl peptidase
MSDATFEDGLEQPLRLKALDVEDLAVVSGLVQDAVFPGSEIKWDRTARRFALLLNRFRWEDADKAETRKRDYERVQSVLVIEDALRVQSQGVDPRDSDMVLSVLAIAFVEGTDGGGFVDLTLAGDGVIRVEVEALEVVLKDVTRPYVAPSKAKPTHTD